MAGFRPNEGEALSLNILLMRVLTDRDANLELGLFTDSDPDETITEATISEPTGGGYARIDLTDANWTGSADNRQYPQQTFTVTGTDYVGDVNGYFIATKASGGTPRLIAVEKDSSGPYDLNVGQTYKVTPSITAT